MTIQFTVTLLQEAVEDLQPPENFAIERELASQTPDWAAPQRAPNAIREGMRLLSSTTTGAERPAQRSSDRSATAAR